MPGRITKLTETQIIKDILADLRRQRASDASQAPIWAHDTFTAPATYQLTSIPYGINALADNGAVLSEGTDYTVDYATGLVTFTVARTAGHVIFVSYVTTGDLAALSGAVDLGDFTDNFNRSDRVLGGDNGWVAQGGTWNIVSNQAVLTSLTGGAVDAVNMYILRRNAGVSTCTVSVVNTSNVLHGPSSLLIGYDPTTDDGYLLNFEPGGGFTVYVRRINSGSPYQLNIGSPQSAAPGAWNGGSTTLAVSFDAATGVFTAYQNGTSFFTVTDPSPFTTGTWVGFAGGDTSGARSGEFWDNFNIAL